MSVNFFHFRSENPVLLAFCLLGLAGCSLPEIQVATPEPIKVDIKMRVDVVQYRKEAKDEDGGDGKKTKDEENGEEKSAEEKSDKPPTHSKAAREEARKRRDDRQEEIQNLKNSRLVGESHEGLLFIRNQPGGSQGRYVKETVEAENADRRLLIEAVAGEEGVTAEEIGLREWKTWRVKSHAGEWVEAPAEEEGAYRWVQKKNPAGKPDGPGE